jgi:hypothetical protein
VKRSGYAAKENSMEHGKKSPLSEQSATLTMLSYYNRTAEDSNIMYALLARQTRKEERRRHMARAGTNRAFINPRALADRHLDRVVSHYFDSLNI